MLCQISLIQCCRMGRHIVVMKLICSLGNATVYTGSVNGVSLPTD